MDFSIYPNGLYSWEDYTDEERADYILSKIGSDDGNERELRNKLTTERRE
jgi:hypothetical protein